MPHRRVTAFMRVCTIPVARINTSVRYVNVINMMPPSVYIPILILFSV